VTEKYKGSIRVSRVSSNFEPDYISIELVEEKSGVHFCDVKMSVSDFADILFSRSAKCELLLRGLHNMGKKCINETRVIKHTGSRDEKDTEETLKRHEVDGWFARRGDLCNMHRHVGNDEYRVVFFKYVDEE